MKNATRISRDSWIITVKEDRFEGVKLITDEEWHKGWVWDGPWVERMIADGMMENRRRSNI